MGAGGILPVRTTCGSGWVFVLNSPFGAATTHPLRQVVLTIRIRCFVNLLINVVLILTPAKNALQFRDNSLAQIAQA